MTNAFLKFINEPTKYNFLLVQNEVFKHPEYSPYSSDIDIIEKFLDNKKFIEAIQYNNINTMLSPRAHLFKNYALRQLGKVKEAKSEWDIARKLLEGIKLTGNGLKENPYRVTRVSDEINMLIYFQEEFTNQKLIKTSNMVVDLITCKSGREIYFDITIPYNKLGEIIKKDWKALLNK